MKIYTRTGDDGSTGLFGGNRVKKNDSRIRAYGTVDEVNSTIGLALAQLPNDAAFDALRSCLTMVQNELFVLGADLATPLDGKPSVPRIGNEEVSNIENLIDAFEAELPPLSRFILPGGDLSASTLHIARTTCRRAEREVVEAMGQHKLNPFSLKYLNRLSDLLFVAARLANHLGGVQDVEWQR